MSDYDESYDDEAEEVDDGLNYDPAAWEPEPEPVAAEVMPAPEPESMLLTGVNKSLPENEGPILSPPEPEPEQAPSIDEQIAAAARYSARCVLGDERRLPHASGAKRPRAVHGVEGARSLTAEARLRS